MNFDDFIHNEKNIPIEHDKKALYFEEIRKEFLLEMKKSIENKEFFSKYKEVDIDAFMLEYAKKKTYLCEHYKYQIDSDDDEYLSFKSDAENVFNIIKQKQLFNIQLKWRAEQITIEGVETTEDFVFLFKNINECNFLPQITESDVQVLKDYILDINTDIDEIRYNTMWQYYILIMPNGSEDDDNDYPDWYKYYDKMMGTGDLLLLPDIKGEKEHKYTQIISDKRRVIREKEMKKEAKKKSKQDKSNSLIDLRKDNGINFESFAKQFETDPHIIELFRHYKNRSIFSTEEEIEEDITSAIYNVNDIEDEYIDQIVSELCGFEDQIGTIEGLQWREALINCSDTYKRKRMIRLLDSIFEEYEMYINLGISVNGASDEFYERMRKDPAIFHHRKSILEGRKELGEPLNFNY